MAPLREHILQVRRSKSIQLQIIRSLCISILAITTALVVVNYIAATKNEASPSLPNILKLSETPSTTPTKVFNITGTEYAYKELDLDLNLSPQNILRIEELNFKFVLIDPPTFSVGLRKFRNLKRLRIQKVKTASGKPWNFQDFQRVHFPQIEEFVIDLDIGFRDQYTDYMRDITEDGLSNLLFYDKTQENRNSSIHAGLGEKLSSDGVEVTLRFDGWTVLSLKHRNTSQFEIVLGVDFANKLLQIFNQHQMNIVHLTMTECYVSLKSFPNYLEYLNLYHVNMDGDISTLLQSIKTTAKLTSLFIESRNSTLKLSQIPETVKTLAIGDVFDSMYEEEDTISAEMVGLGFPMDLKVIENIHKMFINLKKVGMFEPTVGTQHLLLKNVLKTNASWVLLEGFERSNVTVGRTEVEEEIEQVLDNLGLSPEERNFLLFKDTRTLSWYQRELTNMDKLRFRYEILGWNEYIRWDVFSTNF